MIKTLMLVLLGPLLAFGMKNRRVMFGEAVENQEFHEKFQFVVFLVIGCDADQYCYICTGSLVHPTVVLTAAHCFCRSEEVMIDGKEEIVYSDMNLETVIIYVFYNSTQNAAGDRRVMGRFGGWHRDFSCKHTSEIYHRFQIDKDIATVILDEAIDITPVQMQCDRNWRATRAQNTIIPVTLLGFGEDEWERDSALRKGTTNTRVCDPHNFRAGEVNRVYCINRNVNDESLRTGNGDSGSPLLFKQSEGAEPWGYLQVGVHHGNVTIEGRRCLPNGTEVYISDDINTWTEVNPYCEWIKSFFNRDDYEPPRKKLCCTQ